MFKGAFQSQKYFKVWLKKVTKKLFQSKIFKCTYKNRHWRTVPDIMWQSTTWCRCFKEKNYKTGFCKLFPRVFPPFRQFDWFCGALLLALTIFSFSLIERGDFFALFYDNELKFSFPTEKVSQKLLQYSMCSNKGVFLRKWDTYIKRLSCVLDDMEYFAYLHADVIATSLFHIHCRSW